MYQHVLFDLDGTLTDPAVGIITSVRYALEQEGYPVSEDVDLRWVIGPPLEESFLKLAASDDRAVGQRLVLRYRERFAPIGLYENELYDGVQGLLESLRNQGVPCFMATSKPTVYAKQIAEHFQIADFFTGIYGSELDGTRSRKAEVIASVLSAHQLDPKTCVMVGDRSHDIIGACEHHMDSIGVTYGFGSEAELRSAGATHIARSVKEVLGFFEKVV